MEISMSAIDWLQWEMERRVRNECRYGLKASFETTINIQWWHVMLLTISMIRLQFFRIGSGYLRRNHEPCICIYLIPIQISIGTLPSTPSMCSSISHNPLCPLTTQPESSQRRWFCITNTNVTAFVDDPSEVKHPVATQHTSENHENLLHQYTTNLLTNHTTPHYSKNHYSQHHHWLTLYHYPIMMLCALPGNYLSRLKGIVCRTWWKLQNTVIGVKSLVALKVVLVMDNEVRPIS